MTGSEQSTAARLPYDIVPEELPQELRENIGYRFLDHAGALWIEFTDALADRQIIHFDLSPYEEELETGERDVWAILKPEFEGAMISYARLHGYLPAPLLKAELLRELKKIRSHVNVPRFYFNVRQIHDAPQGQPFEEAEPMLREETAQAYERLQALIAEINVRGVE